MSKKVTVLDTDNFKLSALDDTCNMFITIDGKTSKIDLDICTYCPNSDFIVEYNTNVFKGFVVLDNLGLLGLYLKVIKVDLKSTDLVELMSEYDLGRHRLQSETIGFKYNKDAEEFTIVSSTSGDIVFKLKDLEKSIGNNNE